MAFKLNANIVSQIPGKKTGQSWALYDLKSVGVWPGVELNDSGGSPDGTLVGILARFESMNKAKPNQKKPMTFSWSPTTREDKVLFRSILRNRSFYMIIGITDDNGNFLRFEFEEVKLMKIPIKNRNVEQIEATFLNFYKHP